MEASQSPQVLITLQKTMAERAQQMCSRVCSTAYIGWGSITLSADLASRKAWLSWFSHIWVHGNSRTMT